MHFESGVCVQEQPGGGGEGVRGVGAAGRTYRLLTPGS